MNNQITRPKVSPTDKQGAALTTKSTKKRFNGTKFQSTNQRINGAKPLITKSTGAAKSTHQQINTSTNQQATGLINKSTLSSSTNQQINISTLSISKSLAYSPLLFLILLLATSCVTNRKYQYLQNDDVNASKGAIVKDSILRNYNLTNFEYRIQPEDVLSIQFKSLTDSEYDFFSKQSGGQEGLGGGMGANMQLRGYLVDEGGNVDFPVVGSFKISGLTVYEAKKQLQKLAEPYLKNPIVDVRILNFRFTVLGEVGNQGVITSFNNRTSILEAIGMAGGLDVLADRSNIKLIRQEGRNAHVFYINLLDENFMQSEFYYVNQNDVIIVPPLKQRPFRLYFQQNMGVLVSSISMLLLIYSLFL